MKGFILDTDTWIEYFRSRSGVEKHIAETPAEQIYASEVSIAELTYGALHSQAVEKHLKEPREISRYQKSIVNCKRCSALADRVYIYDNSIDDTDARILFRLIDDNSSSNIPTTFLNGQRC